MPSFITPARLAAALGVLTGLGAAVTSLLDVVPHDSTVGRALVATAGVLTTGGTIVKFLDGQSKWETLLLSQAHDARHDALLFGSPPQAMVEPTIPEPETAVLPDEVPLTDDVDSDEPVRLQDQAQS